MKTAKSRSKKAVKNQNASGTITLQKYSFETLAELSKGVQDKFYRMHFGTTLQLVNQYNDLARNLHFLAPSNRVVIVDALDLIERSIDAKISRMNDYLSEELDNARRPKKGHKPNSKVTKKSRKGKSAKRSAKKS